VEAVFGTSKMSHEHNMVHIDLVRRSCKKAAKGCQQM